MQSKSPGISIVLAVVVSMFISGLVLGTMISIGRSFDREANLERSLHFFYASESAVEAALFHKNARGKHAHLPASGVADQAYQSITFPNSDQSGSWNLDARDNSLVGMLQEKIPLEINFYHPQDRSIVQVPAATLDQITESQAFSLTFWEKSSDIPGNPEDGNEGELEDRFKARFGDINISGYPFTRNNPDNDPNIDEPLVDWFVRRLHTTKGYETFRPDGGPINDPCLNPGNDIAFRFCKDDINNIGLTSHVLSSLDSAEGVSQTLSTGELDKTASLESFLDLDNDDYSHFSLVINPISLFIKEKNNSELNTTLNPAQLYPNKIPGIPYTLTLDNGADTSEVFPAPEFTIQTQVNEGSNFALTQSLTLRESTSNAYFNYALFD